MALTPTHRRVQELTPRKVDFAQLDTVVEELVNSTARSTPVQVLLNDSQVSDGIPPDGTEVREATKRTS